MESVCWGVPGIPLLEKASWFRGFLVFGFLVSWFQSVLVSWSLFVSKILGFVVSKILGFLVSDFKDLPNFHFMFPGRYWSHIQDFRDLIKRIVGFVRRPSLRKLSTFGISKFLRFTKIILLKCPRDLLYFFQMSWCLQRWNNWFWGSVTRPKSRNHRNEGFQVLP